MSVKIDKQVITESFFAHKGLNIRKKTDLKKASSFIDKASWQDMFLGERFDSLEWSELDKKVGAKRLKIMKEYLKEIS